ncbi:MAG: murein hydrolase activator EnvC family protein, partial [Bdellovibrionales bacterium]
PTKILQRKRFRMTFLLVVLCLLFSNAGQAEIPTPKNKTESLGELDARLKSYKAEQQTLAEQAEDLEKDLGSTRSQLVSVAKFIQNNERDLQDLEVQIKALEQEQSDLQADLDKDRASIARMILAVQRLRRTPPEAMVAKPGAPINTARSAMLMRNILPALNTQMKEIRTKLDEMKTIRASLNIKRSDVLKTAKTLAAQQEELNALVQKREGLYASVQDDIKDRQAKVKEISAQAKTLAELVQKLERERAEAAKKRDESRPQSIARAPRATPLPQAGKPQLPLQGIITTAYNENDALGAKSKGLSIEGRGGALIVAPMGGTVRFAGHFKSYGNMVILEHTGGYHSLIAGLEKIDTVVDQNVSAGEPIGTLYQSSHGKAPSLYYELRYNGKAVDPAKKFGHLG